MFDGRCKICINYTKYGLWSYCHPQDRKKTFLAISTIGQLKSENNINILSVPKLTANLYCICLSEHETYTLRRCSTDLLQCMKRSAKMYLKAAGKKDFYLVIKRLSPPVG